MRDIHKMDQRPEGLGRETGEQTMERGERKGGKENVTQLPREREFTDGAQRAWIVWGQLWLAEICPCVCLSTCP